LFKQLKLAFSRRGGELPEPDPINESQVLARQPVVAIAEPPEKEAHVG
jgi:hypothetical protein